MGALGVIGIFAFGIAQYYAAFIGMSDAIGSGWAIAAMIVCTWLGFMLPITVGSFWGVMQVWGWHWAWALLFALPGLVFLIPGAFSFVMALAKKE